MKKAKLYVSECFADGGPQLKRVRPRAKGRFELSAVGHSAFTSLHVTASDGPLPEKPAAQLQGVILSISFFALTQGQQDPQAARAHDSLSSGESLVMFCTEAFGGLA